MYCPEKGNFRQSENNKLYSLIKKKDLEASKFCQWKVIFGSANDKLISLKTKKNHFLTSSM